MVSLHILLLYHPRHPKFEVIIRHLLAASSIRMLVSQVACTLKKSHLLIRTKLLLFYLEHCFLLVIE